MWGSLEHQIFDNARVRTLPSQSAEALLPPDFHKTRAVKYSTSVSSNRTQHLQPKSLQMPGGDGLPGDVAGVVAMAGAGLFTAAVITRVDSLRLRRGSRGGGALSEESAPSAFGAVMSALTGRRSNINTHPGDQRDDEQHGYYEQHTADEQHGDGNGRTNAQQQQRQSSGGGRAGSRAVPQQQQQQRGWVDGGGAGASGAGSSQGGGGRGGANWFYANQAVSPDAYDPFPGGYPIQPNTMDDDHAAHPPLRPGDRRRQEMAEEAPRPKYHPALDRPGGYSQQQPPPPPPPSTPPPLNLQQGYQNQTKGWPKGDGGWAGDDMGPPKDYLISSNDIDDVRNRNKENNNNNNNNNKNIGPSRKKYGGGQGGGGGGVHVGSRTTASVPPYGGWGDAGSGPASVPEFGTAGDARAFGSNPPNLHGNRKGGGGSDLMAAMAGAKATSATAVMPPPARKTQSGRTDSGLGILRGISSGLSDGLRSLTGAPDSSSQLREQSEFTARAQRERELTAQVQEAQQYAQMEQKKRQQLEAAYTATRNALTNAESARKGLKVQEDLSHQMKAKIASLEKALNDRDVAAASGVFTKINNNVVNKNGVNTSGNTGGGGGWFNLAKSDENGSGGSAALGDADVTDLKGRMAALESALEDAAKGGSYPAGGAGEAAAVAAMAQLQEKVKMLEQAWGQKNATVDAAAAAASKVDALAAQVHALQQLTSGEGYTSMVRDASSAGLPPHVAKRVAQLEGNLKAAAVDASAVPELRQQVTALRDALKNVTDGKTGGKGAGVADANASAHLQAVSERVAKLEQSLSAMEGNPLSLDVLYAKVGVVEEGLAQTANGSAGLIQDLQVKMKQLEQGKSVGGIAAAVGGVINKAFPPPAAAAAAPPAPPKTFPKPSPAPARKPVAPPSFKPSTNPKPATGLPRVNLPPDFTPAFVVDRGAVKKSAAVPFPPPAAPPPDVVKKFADDDFVLEEGTLPRIATGREVMIQGFNWESHKFDWYNLVKERAAEISAAGFTQIWLPPCTDSLAPEGYLPRNLRSLETKYGGEAELRALIGALRENNVLPVLDAVLNHRCATHQGAGSKWNRWEGTGMDWGEWAITNRNKDFAGQGGDPTGDEFWGSPNIDHREPRVQADICEWIRWLTHDVGFGGIRFDFSKGYGGEFTGTYVRACMPEFAVGEYWDTLNYGQGLEYDQDAHRQRIVDWIDETGGICTAFDFTTKGILQEACGRGEFWRLVDQKGRAPGVIGLWPGRAVTFIDNHDTGSTQSHWPFPSNKVGMGYAYTLTHPGTPSVFWDHYFDWGDSLRAQLGGLLKAREAAGVHSRSKLEIVAATDQVYAALVGTRLAVRLGNDGWTPPGDGWAEAVHGDGWIVWTRGS